MTLRLRDVGTPAALVDLDVVERNCARMSERMASLGARLRPHVKTHKCVEAARLQVRGHTGAITVSTLAEARYFADAGFDDITYAVPLAPSRATRVAEIAGRIERLNVVVDDDAAVDAIEALDGRQPVFLKVDCGYHRAGVEPDGQKGVRIARRLEATASIDFRGVLAHGGHAYGARDRGEIARVAAEERDVTVAFARRLHESGVAVPEVSIGSTPTMSVVDDLAGVTEARPGNYVFFDDFQTAIGSCAVSDRAMSVLATVIGCYPARGQAVIDAGALALSKDPGAQHVPEWPGGYGSLVNAASGVALTLLELHSLSQEHGLIRARPGGEDELAALRVGSRLRVYPNHSCLTAALFDRYQVVREEEIVDVWRPCRGW